MIRPVLITVVLWLMAPIGPAGAQPPSRTPRAVGVIGAALVLGPGAVARGSNGGEGGEPIVATWRDGLAMAFGLGLETGWGGGELRILAPTRELDVRNEAGDHFPHHASRPLVWSIGALIYPIPRLGRGLGRRLRPLIAAGIGGALVSADLDNSRGASVYHPWQWTGSVGLRLEVGSDDPRAGVTVVELRVLDSRFWPAGPFTRARTTAVALAVGLRM